MGLGRHIVANSNRFDVGVVEFDPGKKRKGRTPGPMTRAVRETGESVEAGSEARIVERRQNASDAKEFRRAKDDGLLLAMIPVDCVGTNGLPRDRIDLESVAQSDEMLELKASIEEGGQRDPIEVYPDPDGNFQLKIGWRRLEALRQLNRSEGGDRFSRVLARISDKPQSRVWLFRHMVEENLIREDLSFAEMAQVAINVADDPAVDETDAREVVGLIYDSLNKTKRSYIRSFVDLLKAVGSSLRWPKSVARNIGVEAARVMASEPGTVSVLKKALSACDCESDQDKVLKRYVTSGGKFEELGDDKVLKMMKVDCGDMSARARGRECRVVWSQGFDGVSGEKLEQAITAFRAVLEE